MLVIVDGKPVGQSIFKAKVQVLQPLHLHLLSDISSILRGNIKFPFSLSEKERKKLKI